MACAIGTKSGAYLVFLPRYSPVFSYSKYFLCTFTLVTTEYVMLSAVLVYRESFTCGTVTDIPDSLSRCVSRLQRRKSQKVLLQDVAELVLILVEIAEIQSQLMLFYRRIYLHLFWLVA